MELADSSDLLSRLRAAAGGCGEGAQVVAEGIPAGLGQVDDIVVLLQPLRLGCAIDDQAELESTLRRLAEKNFLTGAVGVGAGGLGAALVCGSRSRGFHVDLTESEGESVVEALFGERVGWALVTARPKAHVPLANFVERGGVFTAEAIGRVTAEDVRVRWMGATVVEVANCG